MRLMTEKLFCVLQDMILWLGPLLHINLSGLFAIRMVCMAELLAKSRPEAPTRVRPSFNWVLE